MLAKLVALCIRARALMLVLLVLLLAGAPAPGAPPREGWERSRLDQMSSLPVDEPSRAASDEGGAASRAVVLPARLPTEARPSMGFRVPVQLAGVIHRRSPR